MICQLCGKGLDGCRRKYCSDDCAKKSKSIKAKGWNKTRKPMQSITYTCKYCGKEYHPKAKQYNTYCSRECSFKDKAGKPKIKAEKPPIVCTICGKGFKGGNTAKYCSDECRKESNRITARETSKQKHDAKVKERSCKECGKAFKPEYGSKNRTFCSDFCCRKYGKRVGKATRRARKRGNGYESINPFEIFERDGWRCQLCGVKTPRKYRGTIKPQAPELDHIIPLALGGAHVKSNVQCTCRECNHNKGATIKGQLILF